MTTRHHLPGGQWADLLDPKDLGGDDQDAFLDKYDELIEAVPRPEPQPDPANPAQMLPAPPRQLGRAGQRALQDWILGLAVKDWSFDLALPYRSEYRKARDDAGELVLPLPVLNALGRASKPVQNELLDITDEAGDSEAPKSAAQPGSGGSEGTSPAGTPSPLPAPPAVASATP